MHLGVTARPPAMVLEDEPLIARDVEVSLTSAGFEVVLLRSSDEAEKWLGDNHPDLAIIDTFLADGPCLDVARILTRRGIPFVVHTRSNRSAAVHPVFSWGAWIGKPCDSAELARVSRSLAGLRRLE